MKLKQLTSCLVWVVLAALALSSCKETENHTNPSTEAPPEAPQEVTHSMVIKFWDEEVFTHSKPRLPKVLVDAFDELYTTHVEEDPKFIEIELIYEIKKGDEELYRSYRIFSYQNPAPNKKPISFGIGTSMDGRIPITPVKSQEHAVSLIHEHCAEVFEEWWQHKDLGKETN